MPRCAHRRVKQQLVAPAQQIFGYCPEETGSIKFSNYREIALVSATLNFLNMQLIISSVLKFQRYALLMERGKPAL